MKGRKLGVTGVALALMAAGAGMLLHLRASQRLGEPGVLHTPRTNDLRVDIQLPEWVLEYNSKPVEPTREELDMLPKDTSFARRLYRAPDDFEVLLGVVLMGTDRTSIHKPEFCLTSQGWQIAGKASLELALETGPPPDGALPIRKFITRRLAQLPDGRQVKLGGVYLFWFVSENRVTSSHWGRMAWITWDLIQRGVLPRWAYVSAFVVCSPGQEDQAAARAERFLRAAVPEFQRCQTTASPSQVPGAAVP